MGILDTNFLSQFRPPKEKISRVFQALEENYNAKAPDPWGLDLKCCQSYLEWVWPLYTHYFRVRVFGQENVENRPYMVAANHSGQLPFDGMMVATAFLMEIHPPRILRAMVERFLAGFPFLGNMAAQSGFVLGDRKNCNYLLSEGESILVFPEGVNGIAKNTGEFYQLRPFGQGFFRMALAAQTDILPLAIVGAEELYPYVYHARGLARRLNIPALPITPFFPLFGFLGLLPLPSPIDIYIGKPYKIPGNIFPESPDKVINEHIIEIENQIRQMIEIGRTRQRKMLPL